MGPESARIHEAKVDISELWPKPAFDRVPAFDTAQKMAEQVADVLGANLKSPAQLARSLGISVRKRKLRAEGGGLEALLMPDLENGSFVILYDPWSPEPETAEYHKQFRIAHELGHTFFYDWEGVTPRRSMPIESVLGNKYEEQFCDRFAEHLLRRCIGEEGRTIS